MKKIILFSFICLGANYSSVAQSLGVSATPVGSVFETVTTGINRVNLDKSVKIFPNPSVHEISVVAVDGYALTTCDVYIYDEQGRLVQTEKNQSFKGKAINVNVQGLSNGVYTMTLKTPDNKAVINKKFVISK